MHAIYAFLVDDEDLFEGFSEERCDENNWSKELCFVGVDGEVKQYEPDDEDAISSEFLKIPQDQRFERAKVFSLELVAHDMGINMPQDEIGSSNLKELMQRIRSEVPLKLAKMYGDFPDCLGYERRKTVKTFERFLQCDRPPFARSGTPYDYRAFDLTFEGGVTGILFVDIHT